MLTQVRFYQLGWQVMGQQGNMSMIPLNILFPKQIACRLSVFGLGGGTEWKEALCILPLNVIQARHQTQGF